MILLIPSYYSILEYTVTHRGRNNIRQGAFVREGPSNTILAVQRGVFMRKEAFIWKGAFIRSFTCML